MSNSSFDPALTPSNRTQIDAVAQKQGLLDLSGLPKLADLAALQPLTHLNHLSLRHLNQRSRTKVRLTIMDARSTHLVPTRW